MVIMKGGLSKGTPVSQNFPIPADVLPGLECNHLGLAPV